MEMVASKEIWLPPEPGAHCHPPSPQIQLWHGNELHGGEAFPGCDTRADFPAEINISSKSAS